MGPESRVEARLGEGRLLLNGESAKVVSERLGHSGVAITLDTYTHVLPSMGRDAADRLGELLHG